MGKIMIRLKINVMSPARGLCNCYLDIPKDCYETTGFPAIRTAIESAYESLGAEVVGVNRVEEVIHAL